MTTQDPKIGNGEKPSDFDYCFFKILIPLSSGGKVVFFSGSGDSNVVEVFDAKNSDVLCHNLGSFPFPNPSQNDQSQSINEDLASSDSDEELERNLKRKARKARARNKKVKMN